MGGECSMYGNNKKYVGSSGRKTYRNADLKTVA